MKMTTQAVVHGLTRFASDNGQKYASVFMVEEKKSTEADRLGSIPMKVSSDYELIDSVRNIDFPANCEIEFEIVSAGQGKGGMHISGLKAVRSNPAK